MSAGAAPIPQSTSCWERLPSWVPLVTPAVKSDSCEVDCELLEARVTKLFFFYIGLSAVSLCSLFVYPAAFIPIYLTALVSAAVLFTVRLLDEWIAKRAANVKAVNEYLTMNYPSEAATQRILYHLSAAQLLVKKSKPGDINKINEVGDSLIGALPGYGSKLEVFKLLVDHGADLKATNRHRVSAFKTIVEIEDPAHLEYVLKNKKVIPSDFTPDQQVTFWLNVRNSKAIHLLKYYGFNINIKDSKGYTPLLRVVQKISTYDSIFWPKLGPIKYIAALLNCGADRSATVLENGVEKNAAALNTNPALRHLLEPSSG
jgi:hypothetical protein